ncbi:hypothetical protein BCV69DRAFT_277913 [Microstroma glucosiphilum]|uniref:Uncharacterized protein n=1 Tax=Pseudomicrostroma glucosiphilum TaxID=1684307 RepID=A0A316UAU1_9BASI|nr:hypothetical protein BCV69DRAFT_277913 [Pseudomicrostroma glucosiphilum]PWN20155.1 hypothetical protein BCV69DRAFT_277913 [Pseudomicrostroma glucosiphilum]
MFSYTVSSPPPAKKARHKKIAKNTHPLNKRSVTVNKTTHLTTSGTILHGIAHVTSVVNQTTPSSSHASCSTSTPVPQTKPSRIASVEQEWALIEITTRLEASEESLKETRRMLALLPRVSKGPTSGTLPSFLPSLCPAFFPRPSSSSLATEVEHREPPATGKKRAASVSELAEPNNHPHEVRNFPPSSPIKPRHKGKGKQMQTRPQVVINKARNLHTSGPITSGVANLTTCFNEKNATMANNAKRLRIASQDVDTSGIPGWTAHVARVRGNKEERNESDDAEAPSSGRQRSASMPRPHEDSASAIPLRLRQQYHLERLREKNASLEATERKIKETRKMIGKIPASESTHGGTLAAFLPSFFPSLFPRTVPSSSAGGSQHDSPVATAAKRPLPESEEDEPQIPTSPPSTPSKKKRVTQPSKTTFGGLGRGRGPREDVW